MRARVAHPCLPSLGGPLVPPEVGRIRVAVGRIVWFWGMAAGGVLVGVPALAPRTLVVSAGLTFFTLCVGHSVGLHRGIIHRAYEAGAIVRGLLAYLFVLSGLGGPLSWARLHATRDYWQNRVDCPRYFAYDHSMIRDFVWNLHLRFEPADGRTESKLAADVLTDPWLQFLESTWPLHVLALAIVVAIALGPAAVGVCVCGRTAASIFGHWAVGYLAHTVGARPYDVPGAKESGTNVWLLGVVSFGEGFHNNHHAFPTSARMGLRKREIDLGWIVICALQRLNLVCAVTTRPQEAIAP